MVWFHFKIHPVGKSITCTKFSKKRATLQWDQEVNTSPTSAARKLWFGLMSKNAAYRPKVTTASLQSHTKYLHFSYIQCLSDSLLMTGSIWKIKHRWKRSFYPSKGHKVNLNHIFTTRASTLWCSSEMSHMHSDPSLQTHPCSSVSLNYPGTKSAALLNFNCPLADRDVVAQSDSM